MVINVPLTRSTSAWLFALTMGLLSIYPRTTQAEPFEFDPQSAAAMRAIALRELPLHLLNNDAQTKVKNVVSATTYFRRMNDKTIECDADIFAELVRYPEILVGAWDLMGVTKVEIQRTAPYVFQGNDNAGTQCISELLFGNDSVHIYYSTGRYTGKLVPKTLDGRSVCVIYSKASTNSEGEPIVTAKMDIFLKLDNLGADLMLRTLSPLVGKTADQNYTESLRFVSQLSRACVDNPNGVENLVERMRVVSQDVQTQFIREAYLAAARASDAENERETKTAQALRAPVER